jgi:hypothetical protein
MRVCSRLVVVLLVAAPLCLAVSGPAGAEAVSPPGACVVNGKWKKAGITVRSVEHEPSDVIDIPRRDIVGWKGRIKGGAGDKNTKRRDISGRVTIEMPLGQSVEVNTWDGTSVRTAKKGRRGYNLPSIFSGVKLKLHGEHSENGQKVCSGSVYLQVEGSATSNPLLWAAVAGLVISAGALVFAARPVRGDVDPLTGEVVSG